MFSHLSSVINHEKHSLVDKEQHFWWFNKKRSYRYISFILIPFINEVPGHILEGGRM